MRHMIMYAMRRFSRILDNLPVAMVKMRKDDRQPNSLVKTYERGYPVGFRASLEVSTDTLVPIVLFTRHDPSFTHLSSRANQR